MNEYILKEADVVDLFDYLEARLEASPCDHTRHHTRQWLGARFSPDEIDGIWGEMEEMGGYCDCEVVMNCYEEYDLE